MRKLYLIAIIIGAILTPIAHKAATLKRGYKAYGGEIFIIPLLMMMVMAMDEGKGMLAEIKEIFTEEVNETYDPYK